MGTDFPSISPKECGGEDHLGPILKNRLDHIAHHLDINRHFPDFPIGTFLTGFLRLLDSLAVPVCRIRHGQCHNALLKIQ